MPRLFFRLDIRYAEQRATRLMAIGDSRWTSMLISLEKSSAQYFRWRWSFSNLVSFSWASPSAVTFVAAANESGKVKDILHEVGEGRESGSFATIRLAKFVRCSHLGREGLSVPSSWEDHSNQDDISLIEKMLFQRRKYWWNALKQT